MIQVDARGRLSKIKSIQTKTGNPMTVATLVVTEARREQSFDTYWSVVSFGQTAEFMNEIGAGDVVRITGTLQKRSYKDKTGADKVDTQIIANQLFMESEEKYEANGLPDDEIPF